MSPPGKDEGYALLDAVVAVLIVSIAAAVLSGLGAAARTAAERFERTLAHIEERNVRETKLLGAVRDAGQE